MSWPKYENTSSTVAESWYYPRAGNSIEGEITELKKEIRQIVKEKKDDQNKYLPKFDPKNLDI